MSDLKKLLNPNDASFLMESAEISWIPKKPREILKPFMADVPNQEEKSDIETRREKAKRVMEGYTKVIDRCKELEAEIEERCKDVKVPLNRGKHLRVMEALARIFGLGEVEEITFDMYKICIRELAKIANDTGAPK